MRNLTLIWTRSIFRCQLVSSAVVRHLTGAEQDSKDMHHSQWEIYERNHSITGCRQLFRGDYWVPAGA